MDPPSGIQHRPNEKRSRAIAKDFPEHQKLLIAAMKIYYVKIWTFDPFLDNKLQAQWVLNSWDAVSDGLTLPEAQAGAMICYVGNPFYVQPPHADGRWM